MKKGVPATYSLLKRHGARFAVNGDRLIVDAPGSLLTPEIRRRLSAEKENILGCLNAESRVLCLSLSEFGAQHLAIEVRVPWSDETQWFVPRVEDVAVLSSEGVGRSRTWTARELANLSKIIRLTREDLRRIALLKAGFEAQVVNVQATASAPS